MVVCATLAMLEVFLLLHSGILAVLNVSEMGKNFVAVFLAVVPENINVNFLCVVVTQRSIS